MSPPFSVMRVVDTHLVNTGGVLIVILSIVLLTAAAVGFIKHRTERDYGPSPDDLPTTLN